MLDYQTSNTKLFRPSQKCAGKYPIVEEKLIAATAENSTLALTKVD
jgi:hypothetical protein